MVKDKITCVADISDGMPVETALKLYELREEFVREPSFKRSVFKAYRTFMMRQLSAAQKIIDAGERDAAKMIQYLVDRSSLDNLQDDTQKDDDHELVDLQSELMKALACGTGVRVEYESTELSNSETSTGSYPTFSTKKHH